MLLRSFKIFCLVIGLFSVHLSKLAMEFHVKSSTPGTARMLGSLHPIR